MPLPLAILDFEAGSLDEGGDPIELGLAIWPAAHESGNRLVYAHLPDLGLVRTQALESAFGAGSEPHAGRPRRWRDSDGVYAVVERDPVTDRSRALRRADQRRVVWFERFFAAADIKPTFALRSWEDLIAGLGPRARERVQATLSATSVRRRARADAVRRVGALATGIDRWPFPIVTSPTRRPSEPVRSPDPAGAVDGPTSTTVSVVSGNYPGVWFCRR